MFVAIFVMTAVFVVETVLLVVAVFWCWLCCGDGCIVVMAVFVVTAVLW